MLTLTLIEFTRALQGYEMRERGRWAHTARLMEAFAGEAVNVNDLAGPPSWGAPPPAAATGRLEYEDLKSQLSHLL